MIQNVLNIILLKNVSILLQYSMKIVYNIIENN